MDVSRKDCTGWKLGLICIALASTAAGCSAPAASQQKAAVDEACLTPEQKAKHLNEIKAPARESGWLDWLFRGGASIASTVTGVDVYDPLVQGKDVGMAAMPDSSFRQGVDIIRKDCAPGETPAKL